MLENSYGVATISRLLKIIGLFCRISSLLQGSFAKKTLTFEEPTNRSHPIRGSQVTYANESVSHVTHIHDDLHITELLREMWKSSHICK